MTKSYDFSKGKRGAVVRSQRSKTRITIRIDDDVLEWFRKLTHSSGGGSYQTMINEALREYMESDEEPLEETLRRVLREVLPNSPAKRKTTKKTRRKAPKKR